MEQNTELTLARRLIEQTGTHLFLTGKAGTGKTTFLQKLKADSPKRMIVLAPTGIAAINAGGVTIHSFFQLPFAPYIPQSSFNSTEGKAKFRFSKEKINIIRSMDLLVIDEISMVRADLLDAVDAVLRRYRNRYKPFGGVQLLLIGDLQQLAPVVKEEEWQLLGKYYDTPYFFSSQALKQTEYCTIELKRVYRQENGTFLDLLNSIRENRCDAQVLAALNSRYIPHFTPRDNEGFIHLVTHNYQAHRINEQALERLTGHAYTYRATIDGDFPAYSFPTDEALELKQGAQVMFVKNDTSGERRYYNGMIGQVTALGKEHIEVCPRGGKPFELQEEVWSNAKYVLNEQTGEITEEVEGTFRQYPLKLAWAITIHKSQGLTFEHAIINAGTAFAHGQAYVALSRCKTLEGLVLSAPLTQKAIIADQSVDTFILEARRNQPDEQRLSTLQQAYFLELLGGLFDFQPLEQALRRYVRIVDEYLYKRYPKQLAAYKEETARFGTKVIEVAGRFNTQYTRLVNEAADYHTDPTLQARIHSATAYFLEQLDPLEQLLQSTVDTDNKEIKKRLHEAMEELERRFHLKSALLDYVHDNGFQVTEYLKRKALLSIDNSTPGKEKRAKASTRRSKEMEEGLTGGVLKEKRKRTAATAAVPADILHPVLYRRLTEWRNAEAARLGVPVYTIIQQKAIMGISNLLPTTMATLALIPYFGQKGMEKYGETIIEMVKAYRKEK
ncbi:MAG: AAA family ATPase [Prevotellaceae bacterium]|nr:AAA family ATPase [Prevotellaceae bacterium]